MIPTTVTVTRGVSVWVGKSGTLILENGSEVVLALEGTADGGGDKTIYHVRMPRQNTSLAKKDINA